MIKTPLERPILFNTAMVQAILDGCKTQTRRELKYDHPVVTGFEPNGEHGYWKGKAINDAVIQQYISTFPFAIKCPYGVVGDQLWVRETFCYGRIDEWDAEHPDDRYLFVDQDSDLRRFHGPVYMQTCLEHNVDIEDVVWKPSIHMPRSACRIVLEITKICVERLNDISIEDALTEGINHKTMNCPRHEFFQLWNDIYGEMSHSKNPWVWVVEFKVIEGAKS